MNSPHGTLKRTSGVLGLAILILLCSPALLSQTYNGRILGSVTDRGGAALTQATVVISDVQRGTSRTATTDEKQGFMKVLVSQNDDRILGFTMVGAEAGEVMASVHTAMLARLSYSTLADTAFAHPTMAEGLSLLFSNVPPRSVQRATAKVA